MGSSSPTPLVSETENLRSTEIATNELYNLNKLPGKVPDVPCGYFSISHSLCHKNPLCIYFKEKNPQALRTDHPEFVLKLYHLLIGRVFSSLLKWCVTPPPRKIMEHPL